MTFQFIAIVLSIGYFIIMFLIIRALVSNRRTNPEPDVLLVSIIIAARNEEAVIENLLRSLEKIIYPEDKYEVILVDDDSSDSTGKIMGNYACNRQNWKALHHKKDIKSLKGKKGAITLGIQQSRGDIILTTDADCVVPPNWVKSMVSCFSPEIGVILGHSPVRKSKGFLNILQRFDSIFEATAAAASTFYNKPSHSNGRNLAFRKKVFEEVSGYKHISKIATGDDFFLTKLIIKLNNWRFFYNSDPESFVLTEHVKFGKTFLNQQLRRNSKAFHLTKPFFLIAAWIFLFHLSLLIMIFTPSSWLLLCLLILLKFIIEYIPVSLGAKLFHQDSLLKYYPIIWLVYPVFIIGFSLLGSLQIYRWK